MVKKSVAIAFLLLVVAIVLSVILVVIADDEDEDSQAAASGAGESPAVLAKPSYVGPPATVGEDSFARVMTHVVVPAGATITEADYARPAEFSSPGSIATGRAGVVRVAEPV